MKKIFLFLLFFLIVTPLKAEKAILWFTGLPCSGKTTLAQEFHKRFPNSVILDGDMVRKYISKDLGFSKEDRQKQQERVADIASLMLHSVDYVLVSLVSPMQETRESLRRQLETRGHRFVEIYVDAPVELCIERDVKGMYAKALKGEIPCFTGISSPYEAPNSPDIHLYTAKETVEESLDVIFNQLGLVSPQTPHALFIGRWSPFHKGHWEIMKRVYEEDPLRPLLIFVRDTKGEYWSAQFRKEMVEAGLKSIGVQASVQIIPDIDSVNWGRGVGYTPREIDVDTRTQAISGTKIRQALQNEDDSWESFVLPGVAEYLKENYSP